MKVMQHKKSALSQGSDEYSKNRSNGYNDFKPSTQGVNPINPRGSRLDPVTGSTDGMQSVKDRPNWNTRNGGYYKND